MRSASETRRIALLRNRFFLNKKTASLSQATNSLASVSLRLIAVSFKTCGFERCAPLMFGLSLLLKFCTLRKIRKFRFLTKNSISNQRALYLQKIFYLTGQNSSFNQEFTKKGVGKRKPRWLSLSKPPSVIDTVFV